VQDPTLISICIKLQFLSLTMCSRKSGYATRNACTTCLKGARDVGQVGSHVIINTTDYITSK